MSEKIMTSTEKKIIENYWETRRIAMRCILSNDKVERVKYGKDLLHALNENKESCITITKTLDDMIEKILEAYKTIEKQNDWLECLYEAIKHDEATLHVAKVALNVLTNYKKNKFKGKD